MNYEKIYNCLIERGKERVLESYCETHHILPRCLGGSDDPSNLVRLTPEEHYIAHQLLVKIYPTNDKLIHAAMMMIPQRKSNKLYGWIRRRFSQTMSRKQTGKGNSQYGTRWIHNLELEENKKISLNDDLPVNWNEGRVLNFVKRKAKIAAKREKTAREHEQKVKHAYYWYDKFVSSNNNSLSEFVKESDYDKSVVSLSKMFKKYVTEFRPEPGKAYKV